MSTWLWVVIVIAAIVVAIAILSGADPAAPLGGAANRFRAGVRPHRRAHRRRGGRRGRSARPPAPSRRARAAPARTAGAHGVHGGLAGHPGRVRRRSVERDQRRRSPHPERDARSRLSGRRFRGTRRDRLGRSPVRRRALRRAHAIAVANAGGASDTESLRQAMQDYRALFVELVDDPAGVAR